jgi:putative transposase
MTVDFCLDALEVAIRDYGPPGILNTDQGSQFTGTAFVGVVQQHGIQLSMDGKGSWHDNLFIDRLWKSVKYEGVYLHGYDSVTEAQRGLACYFTFYNQGRPDTALDGQTPDMVYFAPLPQRKTAQHEPGRASFKKLTFLSSSLGLLLPSSFRMRR